MVKINSEERPTPRIDGRLAIVTGGARGMGFACAQKLAQLGADVALFDLDASAVGRAADEVTSASSSLAVGIALDVTDEGEVSRAVSEVSERDRRPTILVNAAGVLKSTRFADISLHEWRSVLGVSVDGTFLMSKACLPGMVDDGWGRIVNFSSTAGKSVSTLGGAHYTTAKAAVLGLTRAMAKEYAPFGICVNAVCPGLIETEMVTSSRTPAELESFAASFPVGRLGQPEEVAELVAFLASPEAAYITGASLDINGGDLMV